MQTRKTLEIIFILECLPIPESMIIIIKRYCFEDLKKIYNERRSENESEVK